MTLAERLAEYVRAASPASGSRVHEHDDAMAEIARLCRDHGWALATWDVDRGLRWSAGQAASTAVGAADPLAAIRSLGALATPDGTGPAGAAATSTGSCSSAEVVQALDRQIAAGKQDRTFVVDPGAGRADPASSWRSTSSSSSTTCPAATSSSDRPRRSPPSRASCPTGDGLDAVLDAAAGLTRFEAENAFSLSLVRHGRLAPGGRSGS